MRRLQASHPNEGDLLRYADGEVPSKQAKGIREHLTACWTCRTALAELQETVGACVRYRENVLAAHMPEPPAPWFDIRRRCAELDEAEPGRMVTRWLQRLRAALAEPRRWAPALAAMLIVVLVVDHLRNAPSVQAAELLEKATAAAAARPKAVRSLRIRTNGGALLRYAPAGVRSPERAPALSEGEKKTLAALQTLFARANYDWENPLSAASFADWRNGLAEKSDAVVTVWDPESPEERFFRIRTTTRSSILTEATLDLAAADLRPMEGVFEFRGHGRVSITEAPPAVWPTEPPLEVAAAPVRAAAPAPSAPLAPRAAVVEPASRAEELEVLAVLHRLGADLGEPVEVTRRGGEIVVSGMGVSPELGGRISRELAGRPRVSVRFSEPAAVPSLSAGRAVEPPKPPAERSTLQRQIETHLGGRAEFDAFADEVLALSDFALVRAHALRRLADSFRPDEEARLTPAERQTLAGMRREHGAALVQLTADLEERIHPVLEALGSGAATSPPATGKAEPWQDIAARLVGEARRTDSILAAMLGGVASSTAPALLPAELAASLSRLRTDSVVFHRASF